MDFTSFSTVFQLYQGDGRVIVKSAVYWNPGTARPASQLLHHAERTSQTY